VTRNVSRPFQHLISPIACVGEFDAFEESRFVGHKNPIWSLDFSPDGTRLATAGYDARLQSWDVAEGRHVREFPPLPF
jgi:WD40 repeat protein